MHSAFERERGVHKVPKSTIHDGIRMVGVLLMVDES